MTAIETQAHPQDLLVRKTKTTGPVVRITERGLVTKDTKGKIVSIERGICYRGGHIGFCTDRCKCYSFCEVVTALSSKRVDHKYSAM